MPPIYAGNAHTMSAARCLVEALGERGFCAIQTHEPHPDKITVTRTEKAQQADIAKALDTLAAIANGKEKPQLVTDDDLNLLFPATTRTEDLWQAISDFTKTRAEGIEYADQKAANALAAAAELQYAKDNPFGPPPTRATD